MIDSGKQPIHAHITTNSPTEILPTGKIRIQLHIPKASLSVCKCLPWQHSSQHWCYFECLPTPQEGDLVLQSFYSATTQSFSSLLEKRKKKGVGNKHLLAP